MLQLWYVAWVLLDAQGERASQLHFVSGPYPSVEKCVDAGLKTPFPPESAQPKDDAISMGCIEIVSDNDKDKVKT